jgi:hypothetical protein
MVDRRGIQEIGTSIGHEIAHPTQAHGRLDFIPQD